MTIEEKIQVIKEYKTSALAALNSYLDRIYDLTDKYFNEDGTLKEGLTRDEKLETFLLELKADANKYEDVRKKIIDEDFNLSLKEINLIALSFVYVQTSWEKMINNLNAAIENTKLIISQLMDKKS
jgi:hypothetical protein